MADSSRAPSRLAPTFMLRLVGGDLVLVLEDETDVVEAVEEVVAAEGIDLEAGNGAFAVADFLPFKVDRELVARSLGGLGDQLVDRVLGQRERQHAVLEAVVEEDVGVAG